MLILVDLFYFVVPIVLVQSISILFHGFVSELKLHVVCKDNLITFQNIYNVLYVSLSISNIFLKKKET